MAWDLTGPLPALPCLAFWLSERKDTDRVEWLLSKVSLCSLWDITLYLADVPHFT